MDILVIFAAVVLAIYLLKENPVASFAMLLLGGAGWFIGDTIHYAPFFLSILGGAIGIAFTTKEFKYFVILFIIIPVAIGIVGNLIGSIFSNNWGEYGALFGISAIAGLILRSLLSSMFDIDSDIPLILPALLLLIIGILYLMAPGIASVFSWLFNITQNIFSSGWLVWGIILVIFGFFAVKNKDTTNNS